MNRQHVCAQMPCPDRFLEGDWLASTTNQERGLTPNWQRFFRGHPRCRFGVSEMSYRISPFPTPTERIRAFKGDQTPLFVMYCWRNHQQTIANVDKRVSSPTCRRKPQLRTCCAQLTMPNIGTIHDESSAGMMGRQSPLIHSSASPVVARTDPHRLLCKKPFMKYPRLQNANRSYRKELFAARARFVFLFQEPKHWMKQSIRQSLRPKEGLGWN